MKREPPGEDDMDRLVDDGYSADDIMFRRHVGAEQTPVEAEQERAGLIQERHTLANNATAVRLLADLMFLEVKRLDAEIERLRRDV